MDVFWVYLMGELCYDIIVFCVIVVIVDWFVIVFYILLDICVEICDCEIVYYFFCCLYLVGD